MNKKKDFIFLIITLIIIFLIYSPSIIREWQYFDERGMFLEENLFPVSKTLSECFEIISKFSFNYHIESQNPVFSNIINIRSNPLGAALNVFILHIFKNNPTPYHLLEMLLHLINSILVWFIFLKIFNFSNIKNSSLMSSIFTLVWALHPSNTEAVLLSTNWTALVTYLISFSLVLHSINKLIHSKLNNSIFENIALGVTLLISILISEYCFTVPFIIFFISMGFTSKDKTLKSSFIEALKFSSPYLIAFLIYLIYFSLKKFSSPEKIVFINHSLLDGVERVIWISPQIFTYFIKQILFPAKLSIYQSNLIPIATSYNFNYFLCLLFTFAAILMPILLAKKNKSFLIFSFIFYGFIFSLIPFLHIVSPAYCLYADRYTYIPSFLFLLSLVFIFLNQNLLLQKNILLISSTLVIGLFSAATVSRILEWKTSESLYISHLKHCKTKLQNGLGKSITGSYYALNNRQREMLIYLQSSIDELTNFIVENQSKNLKESKASRIYGLDNDSLILKSAERITNVRLKYSTDSKNDILIFYKPFIEGYHDIATANQLNTLAKILAQTGQFEATKIVLEYANNKYPLNPELVLSVSDLYIKTNQSSLAESILEKTYLFFPTYKEILKRLILTKEINNKINDCAKYEYTYGLLTQSEEAYQKSVELYLKQNDLKSTKRILNKLFAINYKDPITNYLQALFYVKENDNIKATYFFERAYSFGKELYKTNQFSSKYLQKILLNLITINSRNKQIQKTQFYVNELYQFDDLIDESKTIINFLNKGSAMSK